MIHFGQLQKCYFVTNAIKQCVKNAINGGKTTRQNLTHQIF